MQKQNYEVEVLVNGSPVKEYLKDVKCYIEGRKDARFSIRIKNNGFKKISAIVSVDGLSVIDGKLASFNSSGYIIDGYDSVTIDGWRVSDQQVREFFFTNPENSYGKRTGKGENLGVIGVAVFREKEKRLPFIVVKKDDKIWPSIPQPEPYRWNLNNPDNRIMCASNASFDSSSLRSMSTQAPQELGTGWGNEKESVVTTVSFEREEHADAEFNIYYNTREVLKQLGIDFGKKVLHVAPQAFPGQYCEPPK